MKSIQRETEKVFLINLELFHPNYWDMNFSLKQLTKWQKKNVLVNLIIFVSCSHDFLCYQSVLCS